MHGRPPSPPPNSGWNSIRPYTPRLYLSVWEISSVSVTLILATTLDPSFLKPETGQDPTSTEEEGSDTRQHGISEILHAGLVVNVNGDPWDDVLMHTGDDDEEAIVTIYGLLPAQQYAIDLHIASADEAFSGVVTTLNNDAGSPQAHDEESAVASTMPAQTMTPDPTPPTSPIHHSHSASTSTTTVVSTEERVSQLRAQLSSTIAERDALAAQLRAARKESQRVDSAIRAEIESLKRTSEKNNTNDARNKRRLQNAQRVVAQLTQASEDAEQQIKELTDALPSLEEKLKAAAEEHTRVKEEMDRSAQETEEALRADRKRAADLEAESAELDSKIERTRQHGKSIEEDTIAALEIELEALNKELGDLTRGSGPANRPSGEFNHELDYPHHYQTPTPGTGSFHVFRNPGRGLRSRPSPTSNNSPHPFSTSQRSLETMPERLASAAGAFYPAAANPSSASFPQMRHPSMSAHPPPRGLFVNINSGFQRPFQPNTSGQFPQEGNSSTSSHNLRGPPSQQDVSSSAGPFAPPAGNSKRNSLTGGGGAPVQILKPPSQLSLNTVPPPTADHATQDAPEV